MSLSWSDWLTERRWYAGRTRQLSAAEPARTVALRDDLDLVLLDVSYADGSSERYQVVVRWDDGAADADAATIGTVGGRVARDALFDPDAASHLLSLIDESATVGSPGDERLKGSPCAA